MKKTRKKPSAYSPGFPGTVHKADCPCPVCKNLRKEGYVERVVTTLRLPVELKAQVDAAAAAAQITFTAASEEAFQLWLEATK
ncbi:MAG: hypothetical protein AB9903_12480 [Vulcanimicrobiota bacterium]